MRILVGWINCLCCGIVLLICREALIVKAAWSQTEDPTPQETIELLLQEIRTQPTHSNNQKAPNITELPLSPGDQVRLLIPGVGGAEFSGDFEVNAEGRLELPFLDPLLVEGLGPLQVKALIRDTLIRQNYFKPNLLRVSVQVLEYAPVVVSVTGEVFNPGQILLDRSEINSVTRPGNTSSLPGDQALGRSLMAALRTAGGIKPTANVEAIQVIRGDAQEIFNLKGLFTGEPVDDSLLISNDQVHVPSTGQFQSLLVRQSPITPEIAQVFVSNLTQPNQGRLNSLVTAANSGTAEFSYGTRLYQSVIAAQCAGGINRSTANRSIVFVYLDPNTQLPQTLEQSVENLIRNPQTEQTNPYLMPGDGIVCYDSRSSTVREIARIITDFLTPFRTLTQIRRDIEFFE